MTIINFIEEYIDKIRRYSAEFWYWQHFCTLFIIPNHISGVMVSGRASRVVDHGFELRSGQTQDYKIGICSFLRWTHSFYEKELKLVASKSG
jgi:hypothetical protein